jgi:drug/metabolite transporter (DMT)-like permease
MNTELLIAVIAGVGGMIGWGLADFFAKKTIDAIGDVTTLFWSQLLGVIPLLLLYLAHPVWPTLSSSNWIWLAILGAWSGLSYIPTYIAFGKGKVSLLSPIFATYAVIVAILSSVFFGEIIPGGRIVAFVVVFLGVLLINGDPRDMWLTLTGREGKNAVKGLPEILVAICFYSVWLIALDRFVNGQYWVPLLLVIRVFSAFSLFLYTRVRRINLVVRDSNLWKFLVIIGIFDVGAFAFVTWGFSASPYVSVVAMLSSAFSLPTIFLARVFLKERVTRLQTIGSLVVIGGVMLLAAL